uniref:Reverse transcriptase Ty1/copia-type domain-containing protein n=1 Tax=Chromera velia CCMP2878 TaxID=1169474 RepID=A0A0G4IA33_9ALVE|eukprot:Cvel_12325.t1-p1 / transcript=Cvel_12325.t1 / gene=Cvel_12325 / organism=Chromera_velia_CCMP2878 / gene_product=Putative transposon Ty5-1 protein YCL074W, putative / transcript_product=Putative transposon Ty5-1 protein YCL074W, putative / location=Cvel_scaffold801:63141-64520(-) / protein_length=460 / sequence_SO=supercontig / SO=protein_coding / is_pseudo=false
MRFVLQLALNLCKQCSVSFSLKKADVVQAYLQALLPSSHTPAYVLPPPDHPNRGHHLWKLLKAVYGLPDADKVFEDFLSSKLRELGWSTTLFPGVWFLRGADEEIRGILCTYVDNLLLIDIGEDAADLSGPLRDHVVCGDDTDATSGCFVGVQFNVTADGILIYQHDYISSFSLPPEFSSSESCPADKPLPVGATHEEDISPPLDTAGARVYRELLGQVGYVAYCTRPNISLAHSYLSRFMAAPTERAFRLLLQTIRYLRSTPSLGIPIRPSLNPDELIAVVHADASFGTPDSPHPQTGWLLFLQGSPLLYKSRRQSRVARSMTHAEVLALEDAVDTSLHFAACLIPFYKSVKIGIGCDAANVLHLLQSGGASSAERALLPLVRRLGDRACMVPLLAVTDLTEQHKVGVFKIPTDVNVSDILTKARDIRLLFRLLSLSADASELFRLAECSRLPPLSLTP